VGRVRHHHFGEGKYEQSERVIRQLLAEAGRAPTTAALASARKSATEQSANFAEVKSPETYIGYGRAANFVSPGGLLRDRAKDYSATPPKLNQWALEGRWLDGRQSARSLSAGASISFRFKARDLHLVLGSATGRPIRFSVTLDGQAPGADSGADVGADGAGIVGQQRLYQLIRQEGGARERTFTITFAEPGVEAFAFTFG
jgi:hypothetical protein